jgi:hypothetical protein
VEASEREPGGGEAEGEVVNDLVFITSEFETMKSFLLRAANKNMKDVANVPLAPVLHPACVVHGELLWATTAPRRGGGRYQAAQGQGGGLSQRNIRYNLHVLVGIVLEFYDDLDLPPGYLNISIWGSNIGE